jgi:hypothetical protein
MLKRVALRFVTTGKLRAAPGPMVEAMFGGKECFFVQVGAKDGVFRDPLHRAIRANPCWRGIFIEPLKILYEHFLLSDREKAAASALLSGAGYRLVNCGHFDIMGIIRSRRARDRAAS